MRRAILLFLLLSIVIVALWLTLSFRRNSSRVAVLPNGVRIEFLGTAIGHAEFTTERAWHKTARRWLPASLTQRIPPASSSRCSSGSNSVIFHFRLLDPFGSLGGTDPWENYTTEDESGFRYPASGGSCSSGGTTNKTFGLILRAYPRRQSEVPFTFRDRSGAVLASLQAPNPVTGPFPKWRPQALPQTQTLNSVTLTLQTLHEGGSSRWPTIVPGWELASSDPLWAKSRVRRATFTDATGNEGQRLSPRESAWRLRALVSRERPEDFSATEVLVLTNLAIPGAGSFVPLDLTAERQGVKLTALVLVGPGAFNLTNGIGRGASATFSSTRSTSSQGTNRTETWGGTSHFVLLETHHTQPDDIIRFHTIDDQGREAQMSDDSNYELEASGHRLYKYNFTPRGDARFIALKVVVNRPLPFEFMVNPADVLPAKSPETKQ